MKKRTFTRIGIILLAALLAIIGIAASGTVSAESWSPVYTSEDLFTSRDLKQEADLSGAETITVTDGQDVSITREGVYVLTGTASGVTVTVDAPEDAKVQLVLDGVSVTNTDFPCIYIKEADKVFITTSADSSLTVTGEFRPDGSKSTGGVIFARTDLTLNGTAALTVSSSKNGIVGKDDLKITGGAFVINAASKCIDANDSIRIAGGSFSLTAGTDALHAENNDDDTLGYIYIGGGTFTIQAGDDGIHATTVFQMDGGSLNISAKEGLEATYVQINGGALNIDATDDGINAAAKSGAWTPLVVVNGGDVNVTAGAGDTDGIDSNRDIVINGGTVTVNGSSTFDYDGTGTVNGGTVILNGQTYTAASLPNQMMGGKGGRGGWGAMDSQGSWGAMDGQGGWGPGGGMGGPGGRGGRWH